MAVFVFQRKDSTESASNTVMQRVTVVTILAMVAATTSSYRPPAPANASTSPTPIGQIGTFYYANRRTYRSHSLFVISRRP